MEDIRDNVMVILQVVLLTCLIFIKHVEDYLVV